MNNISELLPFVKNVEFFKLYEMIIDGALEANSTKQSLIRSKRKYEVYTEVHHILPKTFGGGNTPENLVLLTGEQHFLAHYYLFKTTEDKRMGYAFNQMKRVIKHKLVSDDLCKLYSEVRKDISKIISDAQKRG